MRLRRTTGVVGVMRSARGVCAEPLEERVLCAMARAAGGSGLSGTLSTNPAIRQQQLICDPDEAPAQGSTSVNYDAAVVTLVGANPGPGYDNESFQVLVEVEPRPPVINLVEPGAFSNSAVAAEPEPGGTILVSFSQFTEFRSSYIEMGYVQVKYQLGGDAGQMTVPEGYTVNDDAGVPGFDTHALLFDPVVNPDIQINSAGSFLSAAAANPPPVFPPTTYTVYAAHAGTHDSNQEDFFRRSNGDYIGPDEISPAVVSTTYVAAAPTASMTAPAETCGGPVNVTLFATDPAASDRAAGFTYLLDWGDGSPLLTVPATMDNGTNGVQATHNYNDVGVFTLTLRAVDQHGDVSAPFTTKTVVGGVELRPDPSDPCQLGLFVCGSSGNDVIRFGDVGSGHTVTINGHKYGPFDGFERIIAHGGDGNDDIRIVTQEGHPAVFFGEAGNDTLVARNEPAILVGGDGSDSLTTGPFDDLLLGGRGADHLNGNGGQDLLVGGRTAFESGSDDDVRALSDIQCEWTSSRGYLDRIRHITGATPGGYNGASFFRVSGSGKNVFDDGDVDILAGGAGRDWLIFHPGSGGDITDLALNETGSAI